MVERIDTDGRGKVTGVTFLEANGAGAPERRTVTARAVVVAAGAIETARLLLASQSALHPDGLGNGNGHVGRNLQGHYYPTAFGLFDKDVFDERGPGITIATCDFSHGNEGIVGGGMLADDFIMLPVIFWKTAFPPGLKRWGAPAQGFHARGLSPRHPGQGAGARNSLSRLPRDA